MIETLQGDSDLESDIIHISIMEDQIRDGKTIIPWNHPTPKLHMAKTIIYSPPY